MTLFVDNDLTGTEKAGKLLVPTSILMNNSLALNVIFTQFNEETADERTDE